MSGAGAVFDSYGLLEQILAFASVPELLAASVVNKRWKEAARLDSLWLRACRSLWKDKWGMSHITGDEDREVRKDCLQLYLYTTLKRNERITQLTTCLALGSSRCSGAHLLQMKRSHSSRKSRFTPSSVILYCLTRGKILGNVRTPV